MNATRKLSALQEASAKLAPARKVLRELDGRCMEEVSDKCGIVTERWYVIVTPPNAVAGRAVNVVLYATPHWWDVFAPVSRENSTEATLQAIRNLIEK